MKARTRRRSAWSWSATALSSGAWVAALVSWLTLASPLRADADVVVRFVNGREILAREHWFVGDRVSFTHGGGTVAVSRAFVVAIEDVGAQRQMGAEKQIGGGVKPVNASPALVAPNPIR